MDWLDLGHFLGGYFHRTAGPHLRPEPQSGEQLIGGIVPPAPLILILSRYKNTKR